MHSYALQRLLHEVLFPKPSIPQSNQEREQTQLALVSNDLAPMVDVANQMALEISANSKPNHFQYDVFVSYRWNDNSAKVATLIINELKEKKKLNVAFDRNELQTGEEIYTELRKLMMASRYVVACISPGYCTSPNCLWELRTADNIRKKIFPCKITMTTPWPPAVDVLLPNILYKEFSEINTNWEILAAELVNDIWGELHGRNH